MFVRTSKKALLKGNILYVNVESVGQT